MRKVKIIATIGPSSQDKDKLTDMIRAGTNVVRLNMSHGDYDFHQKTIALVREASKIAQKEVAILVDLQGPKIRVDRLPMNLTLSSGEEWLIGVEDFRIGEKFIPTSYKDLATDCEVGHRVLFDDGLLEARVIEKLDNLVKVRILVGGELKQKKGINLPDTQISSPSITEKDKDDLFWAVDNSDVDYVAISFVRTPEDVMEVRSLMKKQGKVLPIISKIEKPEAIKNIEKIIDQSDGIMVARGDMAVEVGNHIVPRVQKQIIRMCNLKAKPVITATQMLESMTEKSSPTRAEASDVANAVWDGTDAVMLSGETASGIHPVLVVQTMERIIKEAEAMPKKKIPPLENETSMTTNVQQAASVLAESIKARGIVVITESGRSCLKLSSFRPKSPIWAITTDQSTVRKMCLVWGVKPFLMKRDYITTDDVDKLLSILVERKNLVEGDKFLVSKSLNKKDFQENFIVIKKAKHLPEES